MNKNNPSSVECGAFNPVPQKLIDESDEKKP